MKNKLLVLVLALMLVTSLVIAGCIPAAAPVEPVKPIRIGALVPVTGDLSHWGEGVVAGLKFGFAEIGWEIAGRPIELFVEDDESWDEVMALTKARKLVEVDGVDILMGPIASSSFLGTGTYIDVTKTPTIGLCYRGEFEIWEEPTWNFSAHGAIAQRGYALGQYAYEVLGFRTATTMGADYETGYQGTGSFADGFYDAGGSVIQQQWAPWDTVEWGPYNAVVEDADTMAVLQYGPAMLSYVKSWYEFGFWDKQPLLLVSPCSVFEKDLEAFGDWSLGLYSATSYVNTLDTPANRKFVADYEAMYGRKPIFPDSWGYVSALWAIHMLEGAGDDITNYALRDALLDATIETPIGPITFHGDEGWTTIPMYIIQAQKVGGEMVWQVVETYPEFGKAKYYTKMPPGTWTR